MVAAPMEMLRKCRKQFELEAHYYRGKAARAKSETSRRAATYSKEVNEGLVAEIDATLHEWG